MQILSNQVVVQLASPLSSGKGAMPVFSISTSPVTGDQLGTVKISALARAMAGIAPVGASPQLNLAVQYVGSFGSGSSLSFTPFAPAAAAADLYPVIEAEPSEAVSSQAPGQASSGSAGEAVAPSTPQPFPAAPAQASMVYSEVAAVAVDAAPVASVDVSV